jgi:hypothetical protein
MALSKGDIFLEDAIDIREIKNIKLANQLLKMKRTKKQDREEKMAMQQQAMVAQQNIKAQELAGQVAMQKIQAETQSKMQIKQAEIAFDIERLKNEAMMKSQLMAEEFRYNMQLKGMEADQIDKITKDKEDAKDKRISIQNSQQSKLINQRKNNLPPIQFESTNDNMSDLDFSEFEPR